jgi:hypothetical protein
MNNLKWHLFTIRTQIEMRMFQLELSHTLRSKVVEIISRVTDIPRLTAFARRLNAKEKRVL